MQVKYHHFQSDDVEVQVRKFHGFRLWKRWVKKHVNDHGQHMLVHKGQPVRVAYAYRRLSANGKPYLDVVEKSWKS